MDKDSEPYKREDYRHIQEEPKKQIREGNAKS